MKTSPLMAALILASLAISTPAPVGAQPRVSHGLLTDKAGLTLYTFDNDATTPGKSACTGPCLNMWTPMYADAKARPAGDYGLITRDDGKLQWTYKGHPLYHWYGDKKPGDKDGDGLRGVWHVAKP
jgi:predicted lipoprotein with Yx(FWY)xxD motif